MKIGLISDIHSNIYGFNSVLNELRLCDIILCAGDITGYYTFINEVFDELIENNIKFILGNHDKYLLKNNIQNFNPILKNSIEYTKTNITKTNMDILKNTPLYYKNVLDGIQIEMYHGSPWNVLEEYIYPNYNHFEKFSDLDANLIILGHTHIPFTKWVNKTLIVNPGSCGQPRDNNPKASFSIFETESKKILNYRITYDVKKTVDAALRAGINSKVINMLQKDS